MDKKAYIELILKEVEKLEHNDFFTSITIAQAILESNWGKSELAVNANNHFGHKYSDYTGDHYIKDAQETVDGKLVTDKDVWWRKYKTLADGVKDHAGWLTRSPYYANYYKEAIEAKDYVEQAHALMGTYATDTPTVYSIGYAKKLINRIEDYDLAKYDKKKESEKVATLPLKIERKLLNSRKHFGRVNKLLGITLHQSGAPSANWNADRMHQYQVDMASPTNYEEKSWHYQVDDKKAIQSFDHAIACWAAGDGNAPYGGNMTTIQIELCINAGADYNQSVRNGAMLMAMLCKQYGWDPRKAISRHYDWTRKWCPAQIMNGKNGISYADVIKMTIDYMAQLDGGAVDPHNPQGLEVVDPTDYQSPVLPFNEMKEGDTVTITDAKDEEGNFIWQWYNPTDGTLLTSKRQVEIAGTTDIVERVIEIEGVGVSKRAYLLKEYRSIILEEYLVEPRANWEIIDSEGENEVDEGKELRPLKEGQFWYGEDLWQVQKLPKV